MTELRTNCPRDCYDNCGIVVRSGKNGRVIVRGDPDHPINRGTLCTKCATAYNGVWQDPDQRLSAPLRRVGPKGEGAFEPISWEAALAYTAERTQRVVDERGPASVLHTHYSGTLSMVAFMFPMRFFNRLGATEVDPDSICNLAGHIAWTLMFGTSVAGFDPRTAADSSCIVVWGANPSHSGPHMDQHWLGDFDGAVVVVDPIRTDTAARADLHLQLRPGTDAALAFAMAHELRALGAFDDEFIAAHVLGAESVLPAIETCTADWGEQQTGVPAVQIRRAAQLYASGPALLWAGQGLQRQRTGANVMRAVGLLPTLTGNIGKPGSGICYLNVAAAMLGADFDDLAGASLVDGEPSKLNHIGLAGALEDPDRFGALFSWNTNPLASAAEQLRLREAFRREDLFTVVVDCFATDTVDYADIVLPAASFLEFDDLTFSYMNPIVGAQRKVREPVGESLPNQEIFRRLAAAMGYDEPELHVTDDVLIERLLDQLDLGLSHAELAERGHVYLTDEPHDFFADRRFRTPSGRIEIASEAAVEVGLDLVPSATADTPDEDGRFRLLSPASRWRLNDSHANDRMIGRRSGPATVTVHPADAADLGIADGDPVRLRNDAGQITLQANIEEVAARGVLVAYKGRWPKLEPDGCNVNALHENISADIAGCSAVHGTHVSLEPAS
ncbi:MAG: molybdopterin-dependent oxidoreductase [Acidimicrobiales bacterium]|nr:molybdopterin-dependent oxidoreductase [Acidimicrobiaceae bacterium]MXV88504.1 molybdopterin-dependent oxidoreductase [Acidimicrobiales bacterium]MCY3607887.1 molybdopterin-dependent oxidoreductase [Acidimicrobiaceae bacterium]MDE0676882.1 molybdopterin-dependent oxidoreductase [Acidimicrobiaceae bacterium]MXX44464.1 molybdopterin-dependent oxidoreductase [Acidimicrobiales bacterium]